MNIQVVKFGGSVLQGIDSFAAIKDILITVKKNGPVVVVVSAFQGVTDFLLDLAKKASTNPCLREQDVLLSIGERTVMSLLSIYLKNEGIDAISFTGSQAGIITNEDHFSAKILGVRPFRILQHLSSKIVIVAGFQGVSTNGEITTLGRGGSDTTAVALAVALGAKEVLFYKDVGGIYQQDPHLAKNQEPISSLDFSQCHHLLQNLFHDPKQSPLHPRALQLAQKNGLCLKICSLQSGALGTTIKPSEHEQREEKAQFEVA